VNEQERDQRRVVSVVAAFDPGPEIVNTLAPLVEQSDRVIVVEDGTSTLDPDHPPVEGIDIIRLSRNQGIAAALNTGIRAALGADPDALILTMDQDSVLSSDYVQRGREELRSASAAGIPVGAVGAESHNGHPMRLMNTRIGAHRLLFDPMQSGTLYPAETFEAIGLLEEDFVIDAVDTEFNLRMLAAGLVQVAIPGGDLGHELGATRPLTIAGWNPRLRGKPMRIHYHSPYRTFFITRNNITLWRRYARRFPRWIARRATLELESAAVCLVFGPHRANHARAMTSGILAAMRQDLGPMRDGVRARVSS
jgi:rhamnosyltransferase